MSLAPPVARRSWLQISLRAVLIAVSTLCVALAFFYNRLHRQARAVRTIEATGGVVAFDYQFDGKRDVPSYGPAWLRPLVGDECFRMPLHVELRGEKVTDETLAEVLPGMRSINVLRISSSKVTDRGLVPLAGLSQVTSLTLDCPQLTDAGLEHVAAITQLGFLQLQTPEITDAGLAKLAPLKNLKGLTLQRGRLSPEALSQFAALPQLTAVTSLTQERNMRTLEMLAAPAPCTFNQMQLVDALQMLAGFYRTTIDDSGIAGPTRLLPVSLAASTQPLSTSLDAILQPAGLGYYLDRGTIKIAPAAEATTHRLGEQAVRRALPGAKVLMDW